MILVSLDTVRADHLRIYGYDRPTSPNLGRFASNALVFENALSQSAWTLPGHASMMSGLYPGELGLEAFPATRRIPSSARMLAEAFHEAGYRTAGFTGGGFVASEWGFARGFDSYTSDGRRFEHNMGQVLAWLSLNKNRRFFLFLHGYDAHRPYYSESADKAEIKGRPAIGNGQRIPAELGGYCSDENHSPPIQQRLARIVSYYDAAIHNADRSLGRLFSALQRLGLDQRTIVLVTADHGEEFFEHGHCDHVRFLYNETIRVPFLLRIPGVGSRRIKGLVPATVSVPNTLLELAGIQSRLPGPSLVALINNPSTAFAAVFSQTGSVRGRRGSRGPTVAVSTQRFKLIAYPEVSALEAFDLRDDPEERRVLPPAHPFYARGAQLEDWRKSLVPLPAAPLPPAVESRPLPNPAVRDQLRALGYLD